jgi:class 3 adenylate cyclase
MSGTLSPDVPVPSPSPSDPDPPAAERITSTKLVIAVHDLAGYTRAAAMADEIAIATFLDAYYGRCAAHVRGAGGRVVKFIGDAVLAVFPPGRAVEAIEAMARLRADVCEIARQHQLHFIAPGNTNLHLATVAAGEMGPPGDRRFDVLGAGVNHTFLLGQRQGHGVHISEPLYRQLPSEKRSPWGKQRPPAVYTRPD